MKKKVALSLILCLVVVASGMIAVAEEAPVKSHELARRLMLGWLCIEVPASFPYSEMAGILEDNGIDIFLAKGENEALTADELLEVYAQLEGEAFPGDVCPIDLARVFETPEKKLVAGDVDAFLGCFGDCEVLTYIGLEGPLTTGETNYTPEVPSSEIF